MIKSVNIFNCLIIKQLENKNEYLSVFCLELGSYKPKIGGQLTLKIIYSKRNGSYRRASRGAGFPKG
jgi:hypothetical protein